MLLSLLHGLGIYIAVWIWLLFRKMYCSTADPVLCCSPTTSSFLWRTVAAPQRWKILTTKLLARGLCSWYDAYHPGACNDQDSSGQC